MEPSPRERMEVRQGDITELAVDAIVNAANTKLLGGGGVDGAIHRAAGPKLLEECRAIGGCPTGEARITGGYELPARFVIHTAGPVYRDGRHGEPEKLASCYEESLRLAERNEIETLAFPCISTGAYGFPPERAATIAVETVSHWLAGHELPKRVIFCCFGPRETALHRERVGSGSSA